MQHVLPVLQLTAIIRAPAHLLRFASAQNHQVILKISNMSSLLLSSHDLVVISGSAAILIFTIHLISLSNNTSKMQHVQNKCIGDDTKAAARQSLNYIKNKKNKIKIWQKNDFQYGGWNSYALQCGTSTTLISSGDCTCHVACVSLIVTVNSPSGSTLQCDTWLWDDMPLNSPKRPPYWNSTSGFHFHTSPQSICHSVPVCKILSKSDHPRQKKMTSYRFTRWRTSAILDCRDPIMGSLKSPVKLT